MYRLEHVVEMTVMLSKLENAKCAAGDPVESDDGDCH